MKTFQSIKSRQGSALLIVVAFLAMFTILVLGFLARSAIDYQVSDNSTNLSGGDFFSQGAIDCIVGDLKQEIADGSTGGYPYLPKTNANMDPAFSGVSPTDTGGVEADGLNNVLKVSAYGAPFYTGSAINRASNVTTTTASLDNRSISLASWNKPLLMPATSLTDFTPTVTGFPIPAWIYVARDGTNPGSSADAATYGTVGPTVNNSSPANSAYVVGRYSYVIYNEGGLLDVNAAGTPDTTTMSAAQNQVWTRKGTSAFADLTQVPGMTQSIADSIIGWRNVATAMPTATFPTYSFAGTPITNFLNYQISQTTNGMTTGNGNLTITGQSDRFFTSRQQLINYLITNVGITTPKPLQYLGTFSRALNQPSYAPPSNRPTVVGKVDQGQSGPYTGGNSAYQADDVYNPVFRSVQVSAPFARNDGSVATLGEPLVKNRFALSRLCWLTYKGPSANLSTTDPLIVQYETNYGVSSTLINEGTAANIYKYFGLKWTGGPGAGGIGGFWTYNHGITNTSAGVSSSLIGSLEDSSSTASPKDVQSALREPDFFELLKAGVCVGAIAKTKDSNVYGTSYSGITESSVTFQILQLGANIINAASPTQYPIWIKYNYGDAGGYLRSFYGSTDLPYFMSDTKLGYVNSESNVTPGPWPPTITAPTVPATVPPAAPLITVNPPGPTQTVAAAGNVVGMIVPTVWDPYDINGPGGANLPLLAALAPTQLRIITLPAPLTDPSNVPGGTVAPLTNAQWGITPRCMDSSGAAVGAQTGTRASWLTEDSTAMTFANVSSLYRQPTVLFQPNIPAGSGLALGPSNVMLTTTGGTPNGIPETSSGTNFIGWLLGTYPQEWSTTSTSSGVTTTNYYIVNQLQVGHPNLGSTIRLEYQAGTSWIPYQEIYINYDNDAFYVPITEAGSAANPCLLLPSTTDCMWAGMFGNALGGLTGSGQWWGSYSLIPAAPAGAWAAFTRRISSYQHGK